MDCRWEGGRRQSAGVGGLQVRMYSGSTHTERTSGLWHHPEMLGEQLWDRWMEDSCMTHCLAHCRHFLERTLRH